MVYRDLLEKVVAYFSDEKRNLNELMLAKEYFFAHSGKVFADDVFYETRMAAFVEWFALDRLMLRVGLTPIRYYYEMFSETMNEPDRQAIRCLIKSLHSLFQYQGRSGDTFYLTDLYDDKSYTVLEKRSSVGFNKGVLFESRLVQKDDHLHLSSTACVHPVEVTDRIKQQVLQVRKQSREEFFDFLLQLAAFRIRCDRYNKVDPLEIYVF